jgi:uncharacterized protein
MPKNRSEWRAFNVFQDKQNKACMITVWLNEYHPNAVFPKDLFQTWNPYSMPDASLIVMRADLQRVVHTTETPKLQARLAKIQGRDNIYFAGAYSFRGIGLLEQAALSGKRVGEMILKREAEKKF